MAFVVRLTFFWLSVLFLSCTTVAGTSSKFQNASSCRGAFDIYFVLDLSSSLIQKKSNNFEKETVSFVQQLVDKFMNPLLRLSFITFNDEAKVVMPITGDRWIIQQKLLELRQEIPDGGTKLHVGLGNATDQIRSTNQKRASIIIVLTDGILQSEDKRLSVEKANAARKMGATVIAVGVSQFDQKQLLEVVGGHKHLLFETASFLELKKVVNQIVDESCIEITSANPQQICSDGNFVVTIYGRGFHKAEDYSKVKCNFWIDEKRHYLVTPTSTSSSVLQCPSPNNTHFLPGDEVALQVSLNAGVSFISSNVTISTISCISTSSPAIAILLLFLLLFLAALWWFKYALCCVQSNEKEDSNKMPPRPMPPPPPRPEALHSPPKTVTELQQWPTVDASYYGGRGAGGINPMKVKWGDRGCTEGGMHLDKAKDANEVGYILKEVAVDPKTKPSPNRPPPPSPPSSSSCCGQSKKGLFGSLTLCYTFLSQRRPTATDAKNCKFVKSSKGKSGRSVKRSTSSTDGYFDTNQ